MILINVLNVIKQKTRWIFNDFPIIPIKKPERTQALLYIVLTKTLFVMQKCLSV